MTLALALASAWLRLTSPHFELLTDAGEKSGREAITRLEHVRGVFANAAGSRPAPLPVRVFLFRSEREFRMFQPKSGTAGFFQSGAERDHIAMHSGTDEVFRIVYHEYVHLVLQHSTVSLPKWFEEGMAEFYSTLEQRGDRLLVGRVVESHVRLLREGEWSGERAFYASSWALVHMLNLDPQYRNGLPRFVELMAEGAPHELAFKRAFGKRRDAALADAKSYVARGRFGVADIHFGPREVPDVESAPVFDGDADLARMDLALAVGRDETAAKLVDRIPRGSDEWHEGMGLLALHRKIPDEARRHLSQSKRITALFEYAMLVRDSGAPRAEVRRRLEEVVGRNPKHAEAQFLLGTMLHEDGRTAEAIPPLEEAARVLPRQSYFWHGLALAYHKAGRLDDARRAARRAAESAKDAQQADMAANALRLLADSSPPRPATAATPGNVVVPPSWRPREGDASLTGTLERIECLGKAARFHVRADGAVLPLLVANPGDVLLNSASALTFEFSCGSQRPRRVTVRYLAREKEIVAIEFLD